MVCEYKIIDESGDEIETITHHGDINFEDVLGYVDSTIDVNTLSIEHYDDATVVYSGNRAILTFELMYDNDYSRRDYE